MKKFAVLNLVLVLSLLLGTAALAQTGDFDVVQEAAAAELAGWSPTISADALYDLLNDGDPSNDPLIVSVRSPEAYALGHIEGAINIPWNQIADPANLALLPTDGSPIVVYCYTGHTGQVAATILNLLGYNVQNLKYGMMGWSQNAEVVGTTPYDPATAPDYAVETTENTATGPYDPPALDTGAASDDDIVRAAAAMALDGWSPVISADALYDLLNDGDPSNDPLVVSVRSPEAYALGHIQGAINIPWNQIADPANLEKLPPDQPIVVYCYTGHTGQVAATVLKVLGYDVQNLKFGMMGWSLDDEVLGTTRYDPATSPDYPTVGTATAQAPVPELISVTGGVPFAIEGLLIGLGTMTAAVGVYLRRRKAA